MRIPTLVLACAVASSTLIAAASPQSVVDELLAADRAFSAASAKTDLVSGLSAMFADDVVMPQPGGLAYGSAKVIEVLRANPVNTGARTDWTPIRGAVSADGQHGFTVGFMTLYQADGKKAPLKYLSYWRRGKDGWKVLAFKRGRRPEGEVSTAMMAPLLPKQIIAPATDEKVIAQYRDSLADAEKAFSRDAQVIGLGPAFKQYGSPEAINLGGANSPVFLVGNEAISASISGGTTSPVSWGPEKVFVASSGDFGVSIGWIVPNKPGPDGKTAPGNPFFTIWRRANPSDPWRYVAE